ncbi:glutamine--fructose-6-phosphate transaminase (isomerizing) [Fusibacillus kribbianus]|uniref:Glutamine--fructose-6-phosphate aminotransferase [isomerizing] n=1 Tax=Fusibacillus kribbianus TaxID=3044208 RepID=A0AAP4EXJ9_9FIRM|nr:glutamine--fructose-6-phosphate transaminase (isomerizing) [Ruminococcus sp. YH-rum2234]MDI9242619.1 glutamine--fructose-6-phosphate transaminase (isomerizing) [Ruminococcus sp. YH-rum2234]
MCGIIGYTGHLDALKVLLDGLEQLEYRGYDSAGIALLSGKNDDRLLIKKAGPVSTLKDACSTLNVEAHCGIGHTRWATHGGVNDTNAHPHIAGKVTLIHNGIIENYHNLIERFDFRGSLVSETDTEVAARVLDYYYEGDPYEAIEKTIREITGSYAFCIMFEDIPDQIFCVRNVSPMVAAHMEDGSFVASDVTAIIPYTNRYFVIPEYQIVTLKRDGIFVQDLDGNQVEPEILEVNWNVEAAKKNGYPHYMLKEIHEQPDALHNTITPRLRDGLPDFSDDGIPDQVFADCDQIAIVACGTAMYAGMVGKALMEPLLKIPVSVNIASEYRYESPLVDEKTLVIVISQSGETIDTLAALRLSKERGAKVLSVVNVKGSTIARESDYVFYTHAGPEIAVASTKAYMVQLSSLYLIGCRMAMVRGKFTEQEAAAFVDQLLSSIPAVEKILEHKSRIKTAAGVLSKAKDAFFVGRGLDYAFSLEGSLKLKEISYIHAEAYAAGELKHGTIALIEENTPVIAVATQDHIYGKTISNIREVRARGAFVILITKKGAEIPEGICDIHFEVPVSDDRFAVFPVAVILQLLAYYTSDLKGLNVDKPRNLAKSVTVE